jgi:hypothetical protein
MTYEWTALIERLRYHRERLGLGKAQTAQLIKQHYGRSFWHLSDREVVELGVKMKESATPEELHAKLPLNKTVLIDDTDIFNSI